MLTFLFLSASLFAEEYYHFDTIATKSTLFAKSAEEGQQKSMTLTTALDNQKRISTALRTTSTMLNDENLRKWDSIIAKEYEQNNQEAQTFLNSFVQDFSDAFEKHTVSYLSAYPNAVSCKQSPFGGGKCVGDDISAAISTKIDANTELQQSIAEIYSREWPKPMLSTKQFPVIAITGEEYFVSLDVSTQALFGKKMAGHHKWYQSSFESLSPEDAQYKEKAEALYAEFTQKLQQDKTAIDKALAVIIKKNKKKDPRYNTLGFCANPAELGGCAGTDITKEVLQTLIDDKKAKKIILNAQ